MLMLKKLVLLLLFVTATAHAGDISIINDTAGPVKFVLSHDDDFKQAYQTGLQVCRYHNPYRNMGGTCDGIYKFNSNEQGYLLIQFDSGTRYGVTRRYMLTTNNCYRFIWKALGHGYDLTTCK
jgi:hypothetical protein